MRKHSLRSSPAGRVCGPLTPSQAAGVIGGRGGQDCCRTILVTSAGQSGIAHAQLSFQGGMIMLGSARQGDYDRLITQPDEIDGAVTQAPYVFVEDAGRPLRPGQGGGRRNRAGDQDRGLWRPRLHLPRPRGPRLELRYLPPVGRRGLLREAFTGAAPGRSAGGRSSGGRPWLTSAAVRSGYRGFGDFQPSGYFSLACSSETAGTMMTSSPSFQLTGVAT